MKRFPVLIFALLVAVNMSADGPGRTNEFCAADWPAQHAKCRPVPLTKVAARGYLATRIDRNPDSILLALESPIPKGFEAAVTGSKPPAYRLAADSDLYKWLEGACYVFARTRDRAVKREIDRIAGLIVKCQEDDGYINTQARKKRWDPGVKHDLYIAGHFFEAAVAHYRATREKRLLDAACRWADYLISEHKKGNPYYETTGLEEHSEYELGLLRLYRATGDRRYLDFSITLTKELCTVGPKVADIKAGGGLHAVRVGYLLAGDNRPLDTTWLVGAGSTYADTWQVTVPVDVNTDTVTLEAFDHQGNVIGSESIQVVSTFENQFLEFLQISEINFNPAPPTVDELAQNPGLDNDDFEFFELTNPTTTPIYLDGVRFAPGDPIDFSFDDASTTTLAPGQIALVVRDLEAFRIRYGSGLDGQIVGVFADGRLSNGGERITLLAADGTVIHSFTYDDTDPWPERADGVGATLELVDPANTASDKLGKHSSWRGSSESGGTPGTPGTGPVGVVINEVLTNTDDAVGALDAIELVNTTGATIDISGWFLSDSPAELRKFQIPAGTLLGPGEYVVFDERDFNPSMGVDPENHPHDFALSGARGDDVWLVIPNANGGVATFVDDVHFGAALGGVSLGRVPDASGQLVPQSRPTLGCANRLVRPGEVVISELHYNPGTVSDAALAINPNMQPDNLEFIELVNTSFDAVDLSDWRLRGVDFDFATGTMIGPGEVLVVVSFNPDSAANVARTQAFRAHYGFDDSVRLLGGCAGQLSDNGERVRLQQPDEPPEADPLFVPHPTTDEVIYDDLAPWPVSADGLGDSLQRVVSSSLGNEAASWMASPPSPGTHLTSGVEGDLDGDGAVTARDIDLLFDVVRAGQALAAFDLDQSNGVKAQDVTYLVTNILGTVPGDVDLDGVADGTDFDVWNNHRFTACGMWSRADFNGDSATDVSDFNIWNTNKFQAALAAASTIDDEASPTERTPHAPLTRPAIPLVPSLFDVVAEERVLEAASTRTDSPSPDREPSDTIERPRTRSSWRNGDTLMRRGDSKRRGSKQNCLDARQRLERLLLIDAALAIDAGFQEIKSTQFRSR